MISIPSGSAACGEADRGRWNYRVYGLRLSSNMELPGLEQAADRGGEAEIGVELGYLPRARPGAAPEPYYLDLWDDDEAQPHLVVERWGDAGRYHFRYDSGVEFVVDTDRGAVWGAWGPDLGLDDAALYLLGPVLGFLLRLRGVICFHAGAVAVDGRALAVVGPSGAGKSTLTAVLARCGFPVLTDDVLPVIRESRAILALPGYPRLRLRPDVVEHLYGHVEAQPRLTPNWERRYLDLSAEGLGFYATPARLGALYVLDRDAGASVPPVIEPVEGHAALSLLVANTYRNELLSRGARRDELLFLADLMGRVPVRRVRMASGLSGIEAVGRRIIEDFGVSDHV